MSDKVRVLRYDSSVSHFTPPPSPSPNGTAGAGAGDEAGAEGTAGSAGREVFSLVALRLTLPHSRFISISSAHTMQLERLDQRSCQYKGAWQAGGKTRELVLLGHCVVARLPAPEAPHARHRGDSL